MRTKKKKNTLKKNPNQNRNQSQNKNAEGVRGFKYSHGKVFVGDSLRVLRTIKENTYTGVCTDPPYALSFMNKDWDKTLPSKYIWKEALRVTKPGGILFAFGGTRTFHRLAVDIEDAGWEIRDCIMWVYGSGFPKSHSVSRGIDNHLGAERMQIGSQKVTGTARPIKGKKGIAKSTTASLENYEREQGDVFIPITAPATEFSAKWHPYGTALKPAWEPCIVAMKPLEGSYAENALNHGVAGLNIEENRVELPDGDNLKKAIVRDEGNKSQLNKDSGFNFEGVSRKAGLGRWPANLVHDGSEEIVNLFPEKHGHGSNHKKSSKGGLYNWGSKVTKTAVGGEGGNTSRFFYCAKVSSSERGKINTHPTVKPIKLMKHLLNLIKMPSGTKILDPFAGSGTTLAAAQELGVKCDGIEINPKYAKIIKSRLEKENG